MTHDSIRDLLSSYPRKRPPLPAAQQAIYTREYKASRTGKQGLLRLVIGLETWMHRQIAQGATGGRVLEIGAGTLNHVRFEVQCVCYDVVEPFRELWADSERDRVSHLFNDIGDAPPDSRYDRIISIAVLEHLTDLPRVVARSALLLAPGGHFKAGIPSEGGILWSLAWRSTTAISYRLRTGFSYGPLMRHEHLNTAEEIVSVVSYFFSQVRLRRFPLPFHHLSFYTALDATSPCLDRCQQFIS